MMFKEIRCPRWALTCAMIGALACNPLLSASADALCDHLSQATGGTATATDTIWLAQALTTESNSHVLSSITLSLAASDTPTLSIFANNGGEPSSLLGTLSLSNSYSSSLSNVAFSSTGLTRGANSTYWVVLSDITSADWACATSLFAVSALGLKSSAALASYSISPVVTEGPYCLDKKPLRSDIRSDSTTGVLTAGFPLLLTLTVLTLNSDGTISPVSNAYVDIWHCNSLGYYSGETNNGLFDASSLDWLRGYQISNSRGQVKFTTIYPG